MRLDAATRINTIIGGTGIWQGETGRLPVYGTHHSVYPSDVRWTGQLCTPRP